MDEAIFVSYARSDGQFALKLANDLRATKVKVWMDQLDIKAGATWDLAVEDALQKCTGLLVILSPSAVSSRSVMDEVSFALEEKKRVVPVLHQTCEIPFRLRRVQRIDCTSDYSAGLSKLVDALIETALSAVDNGTSGANAASSLHSSAHNGKAEDPSPRKSYLFYLRPRIPAALWTGLVGAIFTGALLFLMFANDNRLGIHGPSLLTITVDGGLVAGALWAVAGVVAGPRRLPLTSALGTSLLVLAGWIAVFGTYVDVVGAAVILGWPVGGIIGASIGGRILKVRGRLAR